MKRNSLLEISKKEKVHAYFPPEYAERLAHDRVGGMVTYFWATVRRIDFIKAYEYVHRLAASAYLQGVNDAAVAMAKMDDQNWKKLAKLLISPPVKL